MSLLDTASLLLTPNAYKEGKLYSVIPSDGSGDFTFTRATTATRVNSDGLVELVPYNLLQYSEQFNNAIWNKSNSSITANVTTAPDGTLTADLLSNTATSSSQINYQNITVSSGANTYSIYAKANLINFVTLRTSSFDADIYSSFNLLNGTVFSQGSGHIASIESVGDGWYRCIVTFSTITDIVGNVHAYLNKDGGSVFDPDLGASGTSSIYLWGAQLVQGSNALPYQKTETRLNIPRLDYSNGTCPSILLEPQRTNLLLQSSSFDNVYWTKGGITLSSNNTTAPDNTLTADTLTENTANSFKYVGSGNNASSTSGTSYTSSVFAKSTNRVLQVTYNSAAFGSGQYANFDLQNGVLGSVVGGTASIQDLGNGWYRCKFTATATATTASENQVYFSLQTSLTATRATAYTGDGTSGIYLWGAQLEAGSYATSYIPTTTASVTRNIDVLSKTGISSLIGQTEGTLFAEMKINNSSEFRVISISDGSTNNRVVFAANGTTDLRAFAVYGGVVGTAITTSIPSGTIKIAVKYTASNYSFFVNGVLIGTQSKGAFANTLSVIANNQGNGGNSFFGYLSTALIYKTALTDDQLAQLTTI